MTCTQCGAIGAEWKPDEAMFLCEMCQEVPDEDPPAQRLKRCECCNDWRPDVEPLREPEQCDEYEHNWELCEECRTEYWLGID